MTRGQKSSKRTGKKAGSAAAKPVLPFVPIPRKPRRLWVKLVMVGSAVLCLGVGVASSALPGIPGFVFVAVGLILLGISVPKVGRWVNHLEAKLPPKWRRKLRPKLWLKGRRKVQQLGRGPDYQ